MVDIPAGHQRVAGSERQPVPGTSRTGPADPAEVVSVTVRLRRRPAAPPLPDPMEVLRQPPAERRYLSRGEFARTYGADPADVARVEAFARQYGLDAAGVNAGARTVALSGTVRQLSRAFAVDLGSYESAGTRYRGREGHLHLPADLADAVEGVFGLDNRPQAKPLAGGVSLAGAIEPLTPPFVTGLYGFPPGPATGQCIGLLAFGGGYLVSDISAFFGGLNLPVPAITTVSVDGATNSPGSDPGNDQEVTLEIDVAGSAAPGASLAVYFAPWTEQGWVDAIATAVHDTINKPSVLSISWGWPELRTVLGLTWTQAAMEAIDATLQEAVALGVTVLAAAGDHGADCGVGDGHAHVMFPASSPFVTACGGTSIGNSSATGFTEAVWNDGSGASGGGVSDLSPLPAWQAGAAVPPSLNDGGVRRGLPDVAGNADPSSGYTLVIGGARTVPLGGTSAVAPLYAGLVALMNAKIGAPVGYLNPALYALAGPIVFSDITTGSNGFGTPGYSAGPGWDACTGLGSIRGAALLAALQGQPNWRWCTKCQGLAFAGGSTLGSCPAGGTHDHTGSGNFVLLDNITVGPGQQANWQLCNKCQGLCFAGSATLGSCPAGGIHDHTGSSNYVLAGLMAAGQAGQSNWRWCNKCQGLCFAGSATLGSCPAGGIHDHTGSGNYVLVQNMSYGPAGQSNWRWCGKCQGMCFAGSATLGSCPAGGIHDHTGSGNYIVIRNVAPGPEDQNDWQLCNKCQGLCFAGSATPGTCPAGGVHDHTGSANYILVGGIPAGPHEQANWQWCNKCQGLCFAGNSSLGPCPAGGTHDHTGSGNYLVALAT